MMVATMIDGEDSPSSPSAIVQKPVMYRGQRINISFLDCVNDPAVNLET
jgi:hypothetical protein